MSLKRNDVTISKTELSLDGNGNGKVGTTSTLSAVLSLLENDKVFLELEAEGEGGIKWALIKYNSLTVAYLRQNFGPIILPRVDIRKKKKTRTKVLPSATVGE